MTQRTLAALILLNTVMLAALVVVSLEPNSAQAQLGRRGTQYMMISGDVANSQLDGLYFINRANARMFAATYDSRGNEWDVVSQGRVITEDIRRSSNR
jgi:uncharacterized membrane protein